MRYILSLVILTSVCIYGKPAPVPKIRTPDPTGYGYMGVSFMSDLVILEIEPDSPAERSGLMLDDKIIRVGSYKESDQNKMKRIIANYRPGAIVEVEVDRNDKKLVFRVELTSRPHYLPLPGRNQ